MNPIFKCWDGQYVPVISALGKPRQENCSKYKTSLGFNILGQCVLQSKALSQTVKPIKQKVTVCNSSLSKTRENTSGSPNGIKNEWNRTSKSHPSSPGRQTDPSWTHIQWEDKLILKGQMIKRLKQTKWMWCEVSSGQLTPCLGRPPHTGAQTQLPEGNTVEISRNCLKTVMALQASIAQFKL